MKDKAKTKERSVRVKRKPNIVEALSAVIVLLVIFFFGSLADLSAPALIGISLCWVVFIGWRCGYSWEEMEKYTAEKIKSSCTGNVGSHCSRVSAGLLDVLRNHSNVYLLRRTACQ